MSIDRLDLTGSSSILSTAISRASAPFRGYGMESVPGLRAVYGWAYDRIAPTGEHEVWADDALLRVDFSDKSIVPSIWLTGRYEATYSRALDHLVGQGVRVLDIGAHVGYYSIRYALMGADVLAFEPSSSNRRLLLHNRDLNHLSNLLTVHACALADFRSEAELWHDATNTGAHALSRRCVPEPSGSAPVQVRRLDDVDQGDVDLIKIDVQGAEFAVLRGASAILARQRPIIGLEYNPYQIEAYGDSPIDMLAMLEALQYRLVLVDEHRRTLREVGSDRLHQWCMAEKADGTGFANVIAIP